MNSICEQKSLATTIPNKLNTLYDTKNKFQVHARHIRLETFGTDQLLVVEIKDYNFSWKTSRCNSLTLNSFYNSILSIWLKNLNICIGLFGKNQVFLTRYKYLVNMKHAQYNLGVRCFKCLHMQRINGSFIPWF